MSENTGPSNHGSEDEVAVKYPNLRPWKKGESGNPKGRPKSPSFKKLIQDSPELSKQEVVDRMFQIAKKGRAVDAARAAEWLAKHSADGVSAQVTTEDFTITIAPSTAMLEEDEDDDE